MKRHNFLLIPAVLLFAAATAFAASDNGLVAQLAKEAKISEDQAQTQVDAVFSALRTELLAGRDVTIKNFGRFAVSERAARTGRNPRTGEQVAVASKRVPYFKTGKDLRDRLNREAARAAGLVPADADGDET